ncbi:MAG: arginine deiminase family protein [Rudaea sp.]|uniref:dimethylargininase n=1 Tax=Rudaea sp. TaxID=2136325 RepID=UPI0039E47B68
MSKIALVRQPSPLLDDGIVGHIEKVPVDLPLAREQWREYVRTLERHGWQTLEVEAADDCPDSVFVEDTVLMFRNVAVITRPGADSRKPETAGTRRAIEALGGIAVAEIREPGTLDGGDVLKIGDTVYVGRGGRTNAEGIAQLRQILAPLGGTVVTVPVTTVLHLKTAVTALPDGTVIGYPDEVDHPELFDRFMAVPEPGSAVVCLSDSEVLMSASAPRSAAMIRDLGYTVTEVKLSEFEKLEGCPTCLSVRIRCRG